MSKQLIDVGVNLNDGTGDSLRTAGEKINAMMSEIYTTFGDGTDFSSTVNGLQNVADDSSPSLGGHLDLNGYMIAGVGEVVVDGRIATSENVEVTGIVQTAALEVSGNSVLAGALTIGGTTAGVVGNFSDSVTVPNLNATNDLQVTNNATINGTISSIGVGSKIRFYFANVASFPSAVNYEGALAFAEDTNYVYFASDGTWNKLAPEASPAFSGTPTAPTQLKTDNDTSIATTAFVHNVVADYAPLASPALTGTPTAPTPDTTDNDTSIATTAYVKANRVEIQNSIDLKAPLASPALTGTPTSTTAATTDDSTQIATTAYVKANRVQLQTNIDAKAPLASPALTGTPTAPTASGNVNNTQIATTAYVTSGIGALQTTINSALDLKAPLASPALSGTPTAPTAGANTNTTQIASTAFVKTAVDAAVTNLDISTYAKKASPALTGTPTAPTPADASNDTTIATTAFAKTAVANGSALKWGGSRKFVSTAAPTSNDGADGDVWFQIEA